MTPMDILNRFSKYVNYDPEQTKFSLLSKDYTYHSACKNIENVASKFDPSGMMGVLYAKAIYLDVISAERVRLMDVLREKDALAKEQEMYDLFTGEDVTRIEDEYAEAISKVIRRIVGVKSIGERDREKELQAIYAAIKNIIENLGKCREEVYINSRQPIGNIANRISTKVHLFNYLGECLVTIQGQAEDGAYLCYINQNGTADGYFAIIIKSNGNLFSINDRAQEAFIGQHENSRNGRWAEAHKDEIFPYEFMMSFDKHDYLGYAKQYTVDEKKLEFKSMPPEAYFRIILAMLCIANARSGQSLDGQKQVYVNTLIQGSLADDEQNALIALDKAGLIKSTTEALRGSLLASFDTEKLLSGQYDKEFEHGSCFRGRNQSLVDEYAQDFQPKTDVLQSTELRRIGESTGNATGEYVGTAENMRLQTYYQIRKDMARHIREKIQEELRKEGGVKALRAWFDSAITGNREHILRMLGQFLLHTEYDKQTDQYRYVPRETDPLWFRYVSISSSKTPEYFSWEPGEGFKKGFPLNETGRADHAHGTKYFRACPVTGSAATVCFKIRPLDYADIREFAGKEPPRILRNWRNTSYDGAFGERYAGNVLLDTVDMVEQVNVELRDDPDGYGYKENFAFEVWLSKRGIAKLQKDQSGSRLEVETPEG